MKRLWLLAVLLALLFCVTQTSFAIRPVAIGDVVHKGGGVYDVRAYGATGDGVTDDFTAIRDATTAANGNTVEFKAGTYIIDTGMTIDEDAVFYKGAVIKPGNGITISLTGAITAGHYQIFDESAGGSVTIGNGMVNELIPQWWNGAIISTFTDTDTTPSVAQGRIFKTANTGATIISMFDDGITGQRITIIFGDGDTTMDFSGTNIKGNSGSDWTANTDDVIVGNFDGTNWFFEIATGSVTTGVIGTPNQIIVTDNGDGTVTLSTPQDIDLSADVTFDSLTLDDLTASRLVATDGAEKLISSDLVNWVTGTASQITITDDGDGTITISADAALTTTTDKDLVSGTGLTGGEDDVLVGADSDLTLDVGAGDGIDVAADSVAVDVTDLLGDGLREDANDIEVYGLVASDGTPNNAVVVDADGNVAVNSLTASRLVASDAAKELVSSDLVSWVTGTASEITVTDDGDGTITLSADAALTTVTLKDLVSGTGLTGGEDNVLVGVDSDLTLNVVAGDGVIANADEIEVYGLVASDGTPNDAVFCDADGNVAVKYETTFTPSATQTITAVGDAILANATTIVLDPDADYVLTSTPTIADGTIGQLIHILVGNAEPNTVTVQDQDTLGGSNLQLNDTTRVIAAKTVLELYYDGTDWIEIDTGQGAVALRWDQIDNPNTDKTFNMGNNPTSFNFISPSGGPTYDGAFEIQANGAFVGDLLHVHQHTGNPGATNLVLLESEDADVTPLVVDGVGTKNTIFAGGYVEFNDEVVYDPSATQVINAVGDTILADATLVVLNPDADYTLNSTPHMADGVIGQIIYISAANAEAFTVTLQDQDTLAGSNFQLAGDDIEITGQTVVAFQFDGTDWIEVTGPSITNVKKLTVINELTIPTDDNPTTDDDGELALDTNDDALEVYTGGKSSLISTVYDGDVTIFAPDSINDEIPIFHVDADKYPHGIKLINVQITIPSDGAYLMVFEEWAGDPAAAQNDIETVTTGGADSYMEVLTGDIDDSDIDADDYIFLHVPDTDIDWIQCKFLYYIKEGN